MRNLFPGAREYRLHVQWSYELVLLKTSDLNVTFQYGDFLFISKQVTLELDLQNGQKSEVDIDFYLCFY